MVSGSGSQKQINLSFDECNLWFHSVEQDKHADPSIFAVNRDPENALKLDIDVRSFEGFHVEEHIILTGGDVKATNGPTTQNVTPHQGPLPEYSGGQVTAELPSLSWNVIRLVR